MKRLTCILLAVFMSTLVFMLSGCNQNATGSVYYLNFKPEQDEQWQQLAKSYTAQTGVEVTVVTAASGNYETTLMAEMGKSSAPTLFQIKGFNDFEDWKDYCLNLKDTKVYDEITNDSYTIMDDSGVYAVAYTIESYGIIVNKKLLGKAGYTVEDIKSFEDLKAISEDITNRSNQLGFAAFTSAGMDSSSAWRFNTHLANMPLYFEYIDDGVDKAEVLKGTYLSNFRDIWDLYINNSTNSPSMLASKTMDDTRNEFLAQKAVFYQNGSWDYANLVGNGLFSPDDVTLIPIYVGAGDEQNQGLCTGTENYWCINNTVREKDIQATLDFVYWCQTSEEATSCLSNEMGFVSPFKKAKQPNNAFAKINNDMIQKGKTSVSWAFCTIPSEEWKNALGSALTKYAAEQNDKNWAEVEKIFTEKWADEYKLRSQY